MIGANRQVAGRKEVVASCLKVFIEYHFFAGIVVKIWWTFTSFREPAGEDRIRQTLNRAHVIPVRSSANGHGKVALHNTSQIFVVDGLGELAVLCELLIEKGVLG